MSADPAATAPHARVLLVEDSPGDASLVTAALDGPTGGLEVEWEQSLAAALSRLSQERFDCVLVDLGLPDADGLAVVDALREHVPDAAVIVLTGRVDESLGRQAIKHGADDYLQKADLPTRHLLRSIEYAVERARARDLVRRLSSRSTAVLAALGDGLLVVDADGRVASVNEAAERMLGAPAHDLIGRPLAQAPCTFVRRVGTRLVEARWPGAESLASGEPAFGVVMGLRTQAGDITWVEVNCSPLHTPDGIDGVVLALRDISERMAAEESTRFQAALLAAVGQAVVVTDPEDRVIFWNPAAETAYGWGIDEALGRQVTEVLTSERTMLQNAQRTAALAAGQSWSGDCVVKRRDGTTFPAMVTATPVFSAAGDLAAVIDISTDISERKQAEERAQALSAIVDSTADAAFIKSIEGIILTWNRGAEELYGYRAKDAIGRHVELLGPYDPEEITSILAQVASGETISGHETVRRRIDGTNVDVSLTVSPIYGEDGTVTAASVIGRDITYRRQLEEQLTRQAMHDTLTGLPNRTLLADRLTQALATAARKAVPVAVLFLDVDQFKTINDAHGHLAGDQLLVRVAQRLTTIVRPADTVARFGGDEFVIVCQDTDETAARGIAERVAAALTEPVEVGGRRLYVSVSIGIAVAPPVESDSASLLRYADAAMYDAKARGRARCSVFDASLAARSMERIELINDLREALAQDALEVHYQPVVELDTGRLVGVEALTRWNHPVRGWVPPSLFVPLAEESGLVAGLDRWVLARACRDAVTMRDGEILPLDGTVAVNISACNVGDPELLDIVRGSAADAELPLEALTIELTETGLMADAPTARRVLQSLRDLGVGIALDDFGTGYSSLTYVRQLPVTTIKIDRSFVQHIGDRPDDLAITASVVDLARAVGLGTVAEGVETSDQLAVLRRLGCDAAQGYLWSAALPMADLASYVRRGGATFAGGGATR